MSTLAYVALWIFVFTVPWELMFALPGLSIIPRVTGALALGLTIVAAVVSGRVRRLHPFHLFAVLFWIWAGIELIMTAFGTRFPHKFWTYGQLILVLWIFWQIAPSEGRLRGLMLAYVLGAYVAAVDTILLFRRQADAETRFSAGGTDGNDLAMVLAIGLPMAWYLGMTYRQPLLRWANRLYVPVAVLAVGLTGSRGGMIATTVALCIVPFSMTRLSPGRLISSVLMVAAAGVLAVAYTPETLIERLATTGAELEGGRVGGRGKLWKAGLQVLPEHLIVGHGVGSYKTAITPILGPAAQVAHNSYISVLVEQGIVGFLLFMAMLGAVVFSTFRLPLLERRFALILMGTVAVAMMPLTWEDRRAVWVVLPMIVGLAHARLAGLGVPAAEVVPRPFRPVATRRHPARPAGGALPVHPRIDARDRA